MDYFPIALLVAAFLCSLVAGFVFAFAVVVMPGIRALGDDQFLRAFQVMDRVIQNNQPVFMVVWAGSVVALLAATALGFGRLDGIDRTLLIVAAAVYLLGVQLPTAVINIPLNNTVQKLAIGDMTEAERNAARRKFEARWNSSNVARTMLACVVSGLLLVVLLRL